MKSPRDAALEAIVLQIGAYFEADDLPDSGSIWGTRPLEDVAADHVRMIRSRVGDAQLGGASKVLRESAQARWSPLMKEIVSVTRYGWPDYPDDLAELQVLMHAIADKLDAEAQRMSSPPDDDG